MGLLLKLCHWFVDNVLVMGRKNDAPFIVAGDIEGFFCLFMNTLLDFTLLISLGQTTGLDKKFIQEKIVPGAGLACLMGNLYYAWEARIIMRRENRDDVTAQPYGIATPSLIGFYTLVMIPISEQTGDPELGYKACLLLCLISGVTYLFGFIIGPVMARLPQAANMGPLATIGLSILALPYSLETFAKPYLAIIPFFMFFMMVCGQVKLPFRLPYGMIVVLVGSGLGWTLRLSGNTEWKHGGVPLPFEFYWPEFHYKFLQEAFPYALPQMTIAIPLAVVNVVNIIQCIAVSRDQAKDRFVTWHSFLVNGFITSISAFLGNPIPTVIYIGQPTFKSLGARSAYSIINGVVLFVLCSFGVIGYILDYMPQESMTPILLYIGLDITVASITHVPRNHGIAVAAGLLPGLAKMAAMQFESVLKAVNEVLDERALSQSLNQTELLMKVSDRDLSTHFGESFYLTGVNSLSHGYLLTSMLLSALVVSFIDRKWLHSSAYLFVMAICSGLGLIHAWQYNETTGITEAYLIGEHGKYIAAKEFVIVYTTCGFGMLLCHIGQSSRSMSSFRKGFNNGFGAICIFNRKLGKKVPSSESELAILLNDDTNTQFYDTLSINNSTSLVRPA
eukprot:CFRG2725T1